MIKLNLDPTEDESFFIQNGRIYVLTTVLLEALGEHRGLFLSWYQGKPVVFHNGDTYYLWSEVKTYCLSTEEEKSVYTKHEEQK